MSNNDGVDVGLKGRETMKLWMLSSRNHYLRQGDNEVVDVVLKEPLPEAGRQ